jgi:2-polyprenyl-3-methyl-5-hydroxy-6-metoxy-1,4-benzoquinol methylase
MDVTAAGGPERPELESHPCNLCGSRSTRPYAVKFGLPIVSCRRCGFVYAEPRLSEADRLKRYSREYFYGEYLPVFRADRTGFDLDLVARHYGVYLDMADRSAVPGGRLLDVGCGAGLFLKAAETRGWTGEGVEVSPTAAEYARTVLGLRVGSVRLEEAGFPAASFDVVTLLDTVEHLADPRGALALVRRLLKPGGRIILNTPDLASASRRALGTAWAVLSPAEHLSYFTARTLRRMLARAGFGSPYILNLLRFNPDCTHAPEDPRRARWARRLEEPRRKQVLENAWLMEYTDLLGRGPGRPLPARAAIPAVRGAERFAVWRMKRFVHGDILVATAVVP